MLKLSAKITKLKQQLLNYQTKQAPKKIVEQSFKECKRSRQTIVLSIDNISMTHDSLILQQIKKLWVSPHNKQNLQALVEIVIYRYNKQKRQMHFQINVWKKLINGWSCMLDGLFKKTIWKSDCGVEQYRYIQGPYSKLIFVEILYYFIGIFHDIFMNFVENLC